MVPAAPADVANGELSSLIDLKAGYIFRGADRAAPAGCRFTVAAAPELLPRLCPPEGRQVDGPGPFRSARTTGAGVRRGAICAPGSPGAPGNGIRRRRRHAVALPEDRQRGPCAGPARDRPEPGGLERAARAALGTTRRYSVDLPGFAYSERLSGPATLAKLADVLPAFLDAVGVHEPLPVMGNSLGGAVAMKLAAEHPDRVSALVLANSAGFGQEVALVLRLLAVGPLAALLLRPDPVRVAPHRPVDLLRQSTGDRRPR